MVYGEYGILILVGCLTSKHTEHDFIVVLSSVLIKQLTKGENDMKAYKVEYSTDEKRNNHVMYGQLGDVEYYIDYLDALTQVRKMVGDAPKYGNLLSGSVRELYCSDWSDCPYNPIFDVSIKTRINATISQITIN